MGQFSARKLDRILVTQISKAGTEFGTWINNYIHIKLEVINHPGPNLNGDFG